jgi:archaellum component FlaG (FlaF/FlaG flagellin family)
MKQEEFLKKVEAALNVRIGTNIANSILKKNIAIINKPVENLDKNDMQILIENVIKNVRLFESNNESKLIDGDLKDLLKTFD